MHQLPKLTPTSRSLVLLSKTVLSHADSLDWFQLYRSFSWLFCCLQTHSFCVCHEYENDNCTDVLGNKWTCVLWFLLYTGFFIVISLFTDVAYSFFVSDEHIRNGLEVGVSLGSWWPLHATVPTGLTVNSRMTIATVTSLDADRNTAATACLWQQLADCSMRDRQTDAHTWKIGNMPLKHKLLCGKQSREMWHFFASSSYLPVAFTISRRVTN